jgi:hypothetical protein
MTVQHLQQLVFRSRACQDVAGANAAASAHSTQLTQLLLSRGNCSVTMPSGASSSRTTDPSVLHAAEPSGTDLVWCRTRPRRHKISHLSSMQQPSRSGRLHGVTQTHAIVCGCRLRCRAAKLAAASNPVHRWLVLLCSAHGHGCQSSSEQ